MNNTEKQLELGLKIQQRLIELGDATTGPHGIWRAIYTEEDKIGKQLVKGWMEEAGLLVFEDAVGNLFGRVVGETEETVLVGSHIDTVKDGGRYDGAAGVVTAISAVEMLLKEGWKPHYTIDIVAIAEEEGSRYPLAYIGSRSILGKVQPSELSYKDEQGVPFEQAMAGAGFNPDNFWQAKRRNLKEYIELHVEQGPYLEQMGITVGLVENIVGLTVFEISIKGEQNHAGTTPMKLRKDAVPAMAQMIGSITEGVQRISDTATVTVGSIRIHPGISNVIPREVCFSIDLRDGTKEAHEAEKVFVEQEVRRIAAERGLQAELVRPCDEPPEAMNQEMISDLKDAAEEEGVSNVRMNSGAGHDAQVFAAEIPSCMVFIPSHNGISHSPEEYTGAEDLGAGTGVLAGLIKRRSVKKG